MEAKRLDELVRKAMEGQICDNMKCCEYGKYNQCYNHAHVLCQNYEVFWESVRNQRREKRE